MKITPSFTHRRRESFPAGTKDKRLAFPGRQEVGLGCRDRGRAAAGSKGATPALMLGVLEQSPRWGWGWGQEVLPRGGGVCLLILKLGEETLSPPRGTSVGTSSSTPGEPVPGWLGCSEKGEGLSSSEAGSTWTTHSTLLHSPQLTQGKEH